MASRSSESVSFERRDEENQLLREENAWLRRVLAAHGIPVPQFTPDDARPVQTITPAAVENRRNALANGSRSSGACFAGEKMSMRGDGRIPTAVQDIHQRR